MVAAAELLRPNLANPLGSVGVAFPVGPHKALPKFPSGINDRWRIRERIDRVSPGSNKMRYQGSLPTIKASHRFLSQPQLGSFYTSDSFLFAFFLLQRLPGCAGGQRREHRPLRKRTARDAMAATTTMAEMEKAACCMIQVIKDTPDLRTTKLALSGDMAIRKYLPEYGQQHAGVSHPIEAGRERIPFHKSCAARLMPPAAKH